MTYLTLYCIGYALFVAFLGWLNRTDKIIPGWAGPDLAPTSFLASLGISLIWPIIALAVIIKYLYSLIPPFTAWHKFTRWFEGK